MKKNSMQSSISLISCTEDDMGYVQRGKHKKVLKDALCFIDDFWISSSHRHHFFFYFLQVFVYIVYDSFARCGCDLF